VGTLGEIFVRNCFEMAMTDLLVVKTLVTIHPCTYNFSLLYYGFFQLMSLSELHSTPTRMADEAELGGNTWRLYDYICRTFIGSLSPNLKYIKTKALLAIGKEKFECSGVQVTSPGFASVMHW
jgi:hypothetical protein